LNFTAIKNNFPPLLWVAISVALLAVVITFSALTFTAGVEDEDDVAERYNPAIKVTVQNGCGFAGVANNVRRFLTEKNVDVVATGNARKYVFDQSVIVVKQDEQDDLKRLQKITGIKNVIYALNDNSITPFIIIAGKDYQNYFSLK